MLHFYKSDAWTMVMESVWWIGMELGKWGGGGAEALKDGV